MHRAIDYCHVASFVSLHASLRLRDDSVILLKVFALLFVWGPRFSLLPRRRCAGARRACWAFPPCSVQLAWPCAYRRRRWIRRGSGTRGSSFWPRLERELAENLFRRSLLSFVESVRRRPVRRGLRGWDRCRFRAPAAPATSCPTPATGSPRRGE